MRQKVFDELMKPENKQFTYWLYIHHIAPQAGTQREQAHRLADIGQSVAVLREEAVKLSKIKY